MHRPGADPDNMSAEDFICDFCRRCWAQDRPMIEGHRGSLICGLCLAAAHTEVVLNGGGVRLPEGETCVLCLAPKDEPHWRGRAEARPPACKTCIKRSGAMLEKDPDNNWKRPTAPGAAS